MALYIVVYVVVGLVFACWAGVVAKAKHDDVAFYVVLGLLFGLVGVVCAYLAAGTASAPPPPSACRRCGAAL